jgi:hypothetical protein
MYKKISLIIFTAVVFGLVFMGFYKDKDNVETLNKVYKNDDYKYIDINQIFMWISNNGDGSFDPRTSAAGMYWPGGKNATITAIFEDGLIWGGRVGREIRTGGSTYRHGLQAGKILPDGTPDDPSLDKYRIYKIRKDWKSIPPGPERDAFEKDVREWPVEDGAPWIDVDGDGVYNPDIDTPDFVGDEVLWFVANDMDPSRTTFLYGTLPMGLEIQSTVFGFNRTGDLGDMVFKKYLIINKGNTTVRDMILGYWSDTDLGDANDDYTGCDTVLSLGYTYNGQETDSKYGSPCPADGYDFFQGPIVPADDPLAVKLNLPDSAKFKGEWRKGWSNLPMTAFAFYINGSSIYRDPYLGVAEGSIQMYNYLQGKVWDGSEFVDPNTGQPTVFVLAGDPVAQTGWYEGDGWPGGPPPGDRRHLMSSGTFTMVPGDTQEVVVGILIGIGSTSLNSITELKRKDAAAQTAYDLNFQLTDTPPAPKLHASPGDKTITLWWEDNAESYDAGDPLIYGQGYDDTTYTFEGYELWQFKDQAGSDPVLLGIWDLVDSVTTIYGYQNINGEKVRVPVIVGPNQGIRRFAFITNDAYTQTKLKNGNPYYFGVTAYGYSPHSDPSYLESSPVVKEVIPGKPRIDYTLYYTSGDRIIPDHVSGYGDAKVIFKIIDPRALTGHKYRVEIHGAADSLYYNLIDVTTGDTLDKKDTDFYAFEQDAYGAWYIPDADTSSRKIYDGFQLFVQNLLADSLKFAPTKYLVKSVTEVKGPGGKTLSKPVNVWYHPNSTGKWMIKANNPEHRLNWQKSKALEGLGYHDYEIRFSGSSPFYVTGYVHSFAPATKSDSLGIGTVPFETWDIGYDVNSDTDDVRLIIKILDNYYISGSAIDTNVAVPDKKWTHLSNGDWEQIYAYQAPFSVDSMPNPSGRSRYQDHRFGALAFSGDLPEQGTVVRITTWKPIQEGDAYEVVLKAPNPHDVAAAKAKLDKGISVFPNPYFASNPLELDKYRRFVRFTGLPVKATIRIYSLSGVFIKRIDKNSTSQYVDWNLLNKNNLPVASGMYLAYIEMPGIGTKVLKLAIIQEQQYIDRL